MPTTPDDLAAEVAALRRRVDALERQAEAPAQAQQAAPDGDTFWALDGLRRREPDPGAVMIVGSVTLPDGRIAQWQQALDTAALLDADWTESADVLGALGHRVRLALLRQILFGVDTVRELTELDGMGTTGQLYHHLRQLVAAGWLATRGSGRYEVPASRVVPLLTTLLGAAR